MTSDAADPTSELAAACAMWQSGMEDGSSLIRGAARVLTGVPHYVTTDFITGYEDRARQDPAALAAAKTLLAGVAHARPQDADAWAAAGSLPPGGFAGRGLKPMPGKDEQIEQRLDSGEFPMPLWGLSLDRAVTAFYGTRFLLEVVGDFPAVPAWLASGIKDDEAELIAGGRYTVESIDRDGDRTHARLRWTGALEPIG